jgi:hypothetical protein
LAVPAVDGAVGGKLDRVGHRSLLVARSASGVLEGGGVVSGWV